MGGHYPEDSLIADFKKDSRKACNEIYDRYYERLVYYAYKIVRNQMAAEDVAIMAMNKLFEHRDTIESLEQLTGFLLRTTRNLSINTLKKETTDVSRDISYSSEFESDQKADALFLESERYYNLLQSVERLPAKERKAIELYLEEASYQEIAAELKVKTRSIKKINRRAIQLLAKLLHPSRSGATDPLVIGLFILLFRF